MSFPGFTDAEVQRVIADYSRTHLLRGSNAMVSIPIDPRRAVEQSRGPKTYSEAVRALQVVALTSGSEAERRKAKKALDALEGKSTTTKETKMAKQQPRAYSSPFGEIPSKEKKSASDDGKSTSARDLFKVLTKSANDPKDPKCDTAKELLRLLDAFFEDEDEGELTDDEIEDAASGHSKGGPGASSGRAKALGALPNRSGYGAKLDRQMGLDTQSRGTRVEGDRLILSAVGRGMK